MLTNHVKLIRAAFIGILYGVLACLGIRILSDIFEDGSSQAPIRSLTVSIDSNQRQELFDQLQKFADKHAFVYNLTDYGGEGRYFLVEIRGDSIKILTNETSRNLDMWDISFFATSPGDPLPDQNSVDNLVIDLKGFLSEIPNAQVTEEK